MEKENRFSDMVKNCLVRVIAGVLLIYILNPCFERMGIGTTVGVNPVSIAAAGALGIPGVVMLYGIAGSEELLDAFSG